MATGKQVEDRQPGQNHRSAQARRNALMLAKLAIFAVVMFGFGWAMIPLYYAICEVTGINALTKRDEGAQSFARSSQVDRTRNVVIEFDTNTHGPWRLKPATRSIEVHPGELATVEYELVNTVGHPMAGQAIPSYAPQSAGSYFRKLECFCFRQQVLQANETRRFPVVFVIDSRLPAEVTTITLSYTFFEVAGQAGNAPAGGGRSGAVEGSS